MSLGNLLLIGLAVIATAATIAILATSVRRGRPWRHVPLLGVASIGVIALSWVLMFKNSDSVHKSELERLAGISRLSAAVVATEMGEHKAGPAQASHASRIIGTLVRSMDVLKGLTLATRTPDGKMVVYASTDASGSIKAGSVLQESARDFSSAWEGKESAQWVSGTEWEAITATPVDSDTHPTILLFAKYDSSPSAKLLASAEASLFFPTLVLVMVCLGGGAMAAELMGMLKAARVAKATLEQQGAQITEQMSMIAEKNQSMAESQDKLSQAYTELHLLAKTDGLTGVMNHRTLMDYLDSCMKQNSTFGAPCSVILLDVDNFKQLNDQFGHIAGDEALRIIAAVLKQSCPQSAGVGRYGGEEFMMVLPAASETAAVAVAEELRRRIQMAAVPSRQCTVSLGVSTVYSMTKSSQTLIDEADKALYKSKADGKNRVTHFGHGSWSEAS